MTPQACRVLWLQQPKLRQCVAGASAMVEGDVSSFEETLVRRSLDDEGNHNVGLWNVRSEWYEENGGEWFGEAAPCGDGLVRGRWPNVGAFGIIIVRAMWNGSCVSVSMRTRERKEADHWWEFIVDWMDNWPSSGACGLLVRTGISSTKVISNADHENTSALIMERYVTDLYCPGNDVTVSHSSANLKHANSGSERQKTAMPKEALVDAASLEQEFRRSFFLMLIIESRVRPDRLYDPKIYSATFKEQVHDAQSLRLVEDYSAKSSQPDVLQDQQPYLYPGLIDGSFQSLIIISLIGWRSIWTLWHYCVLQSICCSFSISIKNSRAFRNFFGEKGEERYMLSNPKILSERGVFIQFMDLPRKLLLQVVAFLVKVPQFEVGMLMCFYILISQHKEPAIWLLYEMEHSPKN